MKKLTLILILSVCAATGCKKTTAGETELTAAALDPKDAVIKASRNLIALDKLSAKVDGEGNLPLKKDVKFVAPDRYQIAFDDADGSHMEMISIGEESYIKDGDSWTKIPGRQAFVPSFRNSFTDDVLETITDAKFEGEETLNGKQALVYSYQLTTKVGNFNVTQRLWVDKNTWIPLKSVAEYTESQEKYLSTEFDAEAPVSIEAPQTK